MNAPFVFDGDPHAPASFLRGGSNLDALTVDPAFSIQGMPPNFGKTAIPHVATYAGFFGTYSKVYRANDEAMKHSRENARYMRNDCGIMECLEARQRATALLDWHIEPEDADDPEAENLAQEVEKIIRKIRRFTEYRRSLLEAIWYGRAAIQNRVGVVNVGGRMRYIPAPERGREHPGWLPIQGDKLVFRYDDGFTPRDPGSVGILSGSRFKVGDKIRSMWRVEASQRGLAAFIPPQLRSMVVIHKHMIEDGAWEAPEDAGGIHGVGVRSRIYWDWFQKQECLAFLIEYLERSAGGIEIWSYPAGDKNGLSKIKDAAKERISGGKNIVFFPKPLGEDAPFFDVQVIEPGMAGIQQLHDLLTNYYGHRIKRYILGQTLTSEAEATGLGSGLAEMHMDSFLQIVRYDATNLEETLTHELVEPVRDWNFGAAGKRYGLKFVIETESRDVKERLDALKGAWEMGLEIPERDVAETVGVSEAQPGEPTLKNPSLEGGGGMPGMMPPGMMPPGMDDQEPPEDPFGGDGDGGSPFTGPGPDSGLPAALAKRDDDGGEKLERYEADGPHNTGDRLPMPPGPAIRAEQVAADLYARDGERWITINGGGGDGQPVKIDGQGNIVAGPSGLAEDGIDSVDDFGRKGTGKERERNGKATEVANAGDVVRVGGFGTMTEFDVHVNEINDDGTIGIGPSEKYTQTKMPAESWKHFQNDLRGVVDVPGGSGHAAVDAVADGSADFVGKGDDGMVFRAGDRAVKVSTTVPFQPFNPGHRSPGAARDQLRGQVATNNAMIEAGVPGLLPMEHVENGDKAFAVMDWLDTGAVGPEHVDQVKATIDAMHERGYTLGDQVQVGIGADGKAYVFDTGKAGRPTGKQLEWAMEDDRDYLQRFAEEHGVDLRPDPFAKPEIDVSSYGDDFADDILEGEWLDMYRTMLGRDKKLSPARARELAAANLSNGIRDRLAEIDDKVKAQEPITDDEEAFYDKINVEGWRPSRLLEEWSGSRTLIADADEMREKYARKKSAPGQGSFAWNEDDHPREADGTFSEKEGGSEVADKPEADLIKRVQSGERLTYAQAVSANLAHMDTPRDQWSAVGITGHESTIDDQGKERAMPRFDMPEGYDRAPTLYDDPDSCGLCGHTIKNVFWLQNDEQKLTLPVGSECVTHFAEGKSGEKLSKEAKARANRDLLGQAWDAYTGIVEKFGTDFESRSGGESAKMVDWQDHHRDWIRERHGEDGERALDAFLELRGLLFNRGGAPITNEKRRIPDWSRDARGNWSRKVAFSNYEPTADAQVTKWAKANADRVREILDSLDEVNGKGAEAKIEKYARWHSLDGEDRYMIRSRLDAGESPESIADAYLVPRSKIEQYARKKKSAPGQTEFQWITIGGNAEGGKKHVGGTPVQVDGQGNIGGGPDGLVGKNLDDLDKDVAGTSKDKRKGGGPRFDKDGNRLVQAPKGGAVSDVNGKFYKGGRWMPVHGLSEKGEKKPKPEKAEEGSAPVAGDKEKGRPARERREMTPEQIAEEKERRERQAKWDEFNGTEFGELFKLGDRPHPMKHGIPRVKDWKEFVEKNDIPDERLAEVLEFAKKTAVEAQIAGDTARGREFDDPEEEKQAYLEHMESVFEGYWDGILAKKHQKAFPSSGAALNWINEAVTNAGAAGDQIATAQAIADVLANGAPQGEESTPVDSAHSRPGDDILNDLEDGYAYTAEDIADHVGRSVEDVKADLERMEQAGEIEAKHGRRQSLFWMDEDQIGKRKAAPVDEPAGQEPAAPEEPAATPEAPAGDDEPAPAVPEAPAPAPAPVDEPEAPAAGESEPKPDDGTLFGADPADSPRGEARERAKKLDEDYEFARASAIPNAGEDLKGSARHTRNAWRSIAEAEADGQGDTFATRKYLAKTEPADLHEAADENPLSALAMHYAMAKFPAKAEYRGRKGGARDRERFVETYTSLKEEAERIARNTVDPKEAMHQMRQAVGNTITALRERDRYDVVANGLVAMHKALGYSNWGRPSKTSVQGRLAEFAGALAEKHEDPAEGLANAGEYVKDLLEGASLNKAFGRKAEKSSKFKPADMYVKVAERKGGRELSAKTANAAVGTMVDSMGIRGVQFGNSVTDDEREHHATKSAEAFMDLADVTGLGDTDMSLGGKLGLAIGARGKAGAMAHYEPGTGVINLTRKNGVGSLAHEWGHFFDHHIGGGGTDKGPNDYASNQIAEKQPVFDDNGALVWEEKDGKRKPKMLDMKDDPVWAAGQGIRDAMRTSGFNERMWQSLNAAIRDRRVPESKRDYFASKHEKFARCFERYVQKKLEGEGRSNTYLAGFDAHKEDESFGLWPTDAEVEAMTPAFDNLFAAYRQSQES